MKPYAQDMLPDGKTWMVKAYVVHCYKDAIECKANVKKEITARGKLICGAQPFRVISCEMKDRQISTVAAHCLLKCGEKPVNSKKTDESNDQNFNLD